MWILLFLWDIDVTTIVPLGNAFVIMISHMCDIGKKNKGEFLFIKDIWCLGSSALYAKMLLLRIVENNKIDDYLDQVRLSKG